MVSKFGAGDGLCVRADAVLRSLVARDHEVHAFTQSKHVQLLPEERIHRFRAVQLNPHFSLDVVHAPGMIARESQRHGIDVLHAQMNSGSTDFLLPFFKRALPPLVVTYHLAYAGSDSLVGTIFDIATKASLFAGKRYDAVILVHPLHKRMFLESGFPEEKLHVIVNGVDTHRFCPAPTRRDDEIINFIYVGRLSYDKGVDITIEAFREYHKENPDTRLTLIGDGMLKSMLSGRKAINDGIHWLGNVPHSKVDDFLKMGDVFVVPMSIGPLTSSMSVLEAMSCGLPLITTRVRDAEKLLSPTEGMLVESQSVRAVIDAMRLMAQDKAKRVSMGMKCRQRILREHSWEKQVELIEEVYHSLSN